MKDVLKGFDVLVAFLFVLPLAVLGLIELKYAVMYFAAMPFMIIIGFSI